MQPMISHHLAEPIRALEFSPDGLAWQPIPDPINVLGSRYALCITNLREVDLDLSLGSTEVALGNSKGLRGDDYVKGRVDKACLEVVTEELDEAEIPIKLIADVVEPYAVFLRT
jgi:hypothetical protein